MSDTTILPTTPAYVQITDGHRGNHGHHNHGITDKDRMHLNTDFLDSAIRDLKNNISDDTASVLVGVERNGRSAELATEKTAAATQMSAEKGSHEIQLATSLGFTNTQNLLISGFKDGRYDAAVNTASIQATAAVNASAAALAACQNTAAIQASIAECCCETKELIRAEAGATRDLVNSLNVTNLSVALVDAKNEILALRLGGGKKD